MTEAVVRRDFETFESYFAPIAVWCAPVLGMTFEGRAANLRFAALSKTGGVYEEYEIEFVEHLDLRNDVSFAVERMGRGPRSRGPEEYEGDPSVGDKRCRPFLTIGEVNVWTRETSE